jgi:hypothetical protein
MQKFLTILALLTTSVPATAFGLGLDLELGGATQQLYDDSANTVTADRSLGGVVLRGGVSVTDELAVGVEWWPSSEQAVLAGQDTLLDLDTFTVDAQYRLITKGWVQPYVRGGVGVTWTTFRIDDPASFSSETFAPHGLAAIGCAVMIPRELPDRTLAASFGLSFELGYQHALGQDLQLSNDRTRSPNLAAASLDLGTLTLTGLLARVAVVVRL